MSQKKIPETAAINAGLESLKTGHGVVGKVAVTVDRNAS
jgi:hypothetical protein